MKNKFAIITTISSGYMFALNVNFNTNKFFGTNADYHVIYHEEMDKQYMEDCIEAFKDHFKIIWIPMSEVSRDFHNAKYKYAKTLAGQYDAICLIDADLFIIENLLKFFDLAHGRNGLISAQHLWAGGDVDALQFDNWEKCIDRAYAQVADFPIFIDPNLEKSQKMFQDWYEFASAGNNEENHPLVAFNRSICKNFTKEEISLLDGHLWVADKDFWIANYRWDREKNLISVNSEENPNVYLKVSAIHNKWWKSGRANGEFVANRWVTKDHPIYRNLVQGEHNFNEIKDFMAFFNDMTPKTRRSDYLQEKIVLTDILPHLK